MGGVAATDQPRFLLATALPGARERRISLFIAISTLLLFLAFVPFVRTPLVPMPAFIPTYEAALLLIDLITALLLFDQFARHRNAGMLVLACGYLFDALIIVPHALSFPGAFTVTGMLGAGAQTTAWLYVFWHGGFALFVLAYALLRPRRPTGSERMLSQVGPPVLMAVIGVVLLTIALTLAATAGHDWLPVVMQGSDYSLLVRKGITPAVCGLTLIALVALWQPPLRALDLRLMVVMWVWLLDIALSAVIGSARYDLGFYAGRIFGLVASSFLLIALLAEMARMHSGAIGAAANAEQRLAQLVRTQRIDSGAPSSKDISHFIHRQNLEHYRVLLQSDRLDEKQRRSIETLLAEEERGPDGPIA